MARQVIGTFSTWLPDHPRTPDGPLRTSVLADAEITRPEAHDQASWGVWDPQVIAGARVVVKAD